MSKSENAAKRAAGVLRNEGFNNVMVTKIGSSSSVVDFEIPVTMPWEKRRGVSSSLHVTKDGSAGDAVIRFPGAKPNQGRQRAMNAAQRHTYWDENIIPAEQGMIHVHILFRPYKNMSKDPQQIARQMVSIIDRYYA